MGWGLSATGRPSSPRRRVFRVHWLANQLPQRHALTLQPSPPPKVLPSLCAILLLSHGLDLKENMCEVIVMLDIFNLLGIYSPNNRIIRNAKGRQQFLILRQRHLKKVHQKNLSPWALACSKVMAEAHGAPSLAGKCPPTLLSHYLARRGQEQLTGRPGWRCSRPGKTLPQPPSHSQALGTSPRSRVLLYLLSLSGLS